jgi:hypothetical protein
MEYAHFERLKRSLPVMGHSKVGRWLLDWLVAGIHTGLRPMEWGLALIEKRPARCCLHGERIWLHVVTARATDGRGTHQTLDISEFSAETLEAIERTVNRSRDWVLSGQSAMWQSEVSKLLRKACQTLFPLMKLQYTLYSLRHQFIANMKTIYSREEVAAMADHVSTDTHLDHYRKRRASWTDQQITEVPVPMQEQVVRIKKRLESFDERRDFKAMKDAARRRAE